MQIAAEREQSCEQIAGVLRTMKDRIQRKDELLQGYERDLAKLRLAERHPHTHTVLTNLGNGLAYKLTYYWLCVCNIVVLWLNA